MTGAAGSRDPARAIPKTPTGIAGLDEITGGGLPRGRTTLIIGGPGCGKTLLGVEFLVSGALDHDEPGVLIAFEETGEEIAENVRSLGYDLEALARQQKLVVDHVRIERSEIEETGDYDLEGLFVRLGYAIESIGAKRVVIDTLEVLFAGLQNHAILRAELRRLFRWLKEREVTAIVTAERGAAPATTRHGLEEYVSDCVIVLDHRVEQQVSTRRLRVVKYRGSSHGANEYPFLIDEGGLAVFPITSVGLDYPAPQGAIPTGVQGLDAALDGRGYLRGSSVLLVGPAGCGKTSLGAAFVDAACARGERSLFLSMEESAEQIVRNMRSLGIDLERWRSAGLLRIQSSRPTFQGLEAHLAAISRSLDAFRPRVLVMDPITNLGVVGSDLQVGSMITRLFDLAKARQITGLFTALSSDQDDHAGATMSSWADTLIVIRYAERDRTRRRTLSIIKARGMPHSDSIHELVLASSGPRLASLGEKR